MQKGRKGLASVLAAVLLLSAALTGCGGSGSAATEAPGTATKQTEAKQTEAKQAEAAQTASAETAGGNAQAGKQLKIVATIFPEYDWVREILGENPGGAELHFLLENGVDLHSFQPSAADILTISDCDLFLYVGGESDRWVEDALKEGRNPNRQVINLLEVLGDRVRVEEIVEGMEHDHDHEEHAHEGEDHEHEGEEHEHEAEYDEHVWLSLRHAEVLCVAITDALCQLDPVNAELYRKNLGAYEDKLHALDEQYQAAVSGGSRQTVLFGDRFPFRYLTDDYGITYYAAFAGCSAETEASFETIAFLSGKMDELSLPCVLTIEGKDHRIAETIVQNTKEKNQSVLVMDSLQATTLKQAESGVTYLSVMESNLETLKKALN